VCRIDDDDATVVVRASRRLGLPAWPSQSHGRPASIRSSGTTVPEARMAGETLEKRGRTLEAIVEPLQQLPARVTALESQFLHFQAEVRGEFSAVRSEIRASAESVQTGLRAEIRSSADEVRAEMQALIGETRAEMRALNEETRAEMRATNEE